MQDSFLDALKSYIQQFKYEAGSENYTQIINDRNFDRLLKLIDSNKIFFGGKSDAKRRYIEPTILKNVNWNDNVMQEEIFGPILPVLTFNNFNEALLNIAKNEKPLSAYLFTDNEEEKEYFISKISFGGGCINDVIMHLGNDNLPFGGVGNSGMGNYHGKFGFDTFSHQKAILDRATWGEPDLKYPPYTEKKLNLIKKLL